jgi:peptidoglycan-associated lipoprotein
MRCLPLKWIGACACLVLIIGCGPNYPKCNKDKDCHEKEFCVNGQCQQCRSDQDCKEGEGCNKGRCEPKQAGCTDDSQCPAGQSCIDGSCKPCASDDQCGVGGKCNQGRCQRAGASSKTGTEDALTAGKGCKLEPVYFDFNEYALSTEATSAIDKNADCIKQTGGQKAILLTGRTDPRGTEEYNLALSDHRAQTVRDRLGRMGVDGGRLRTVARGELDASGTDESGWAKDRRVDVNW